MIVMTASPAFAENGDGAEAGGAAGASGGTGGGNGEVEIRIRERKPSRPQTQTKKKRDPYWRYWTEKTVEPTGAGANCANGEVWRLWKIRRSDDSVRRLVRGPACPWSTNGGSPPSDAELFKMKEIKAPPVTLNPLPSGLTGLQTGLWYEGEREVTIDGNLNGYVVVASVKPTSYRWIMGDGHEHVSLSPGGPAEADWAARHTYETRGDYDITLEVTWAGSYTFTSADGASTTVPLGPITVEGKRRYHVIEVRSGLEELGDS
jgi:hypothetical protein